jgi:hypothetical protein
MVHDSFTSLPVSAKHCPLVSAGVVVKVPEQSVVEKTLMTAVFPVTATVIFMLLDAGPESCVPKMHWPSKSKHQANRSNNRKNERNWNLLIADAWPT